MATEKKELTPAQEAAESAKQTAKDDAMLRNATPDQIAAAGITNGMQRDEMVRRMRRILPE